MMHTLYLGLGSNLGHRHENIRKAVALIDERIGSVYRMSDYMESPAWGYESKNDYINAACLVHTMFTPEKVLAETQRIECELGRTEKSSVDADGKPIYHDRTIDIDILLYDNVHINTPELVIPHPFVKERDFVRIPLEQIFIS